MRINRNRRRKFENKGRLKDFQTAFVFMIVLNFKEQHDECSGYRTKNVTAPNLLMPPKKFQLKILPKSKRHCATVLPASISKPWHFVITDNEAGKARVAKSAENFPYNLPKIINASHVIVFAARVHADDDYLAGVLEQEDKDGRFATAENKQMGDNARCTFLGIHRNQMQDETQWLSRQVHINLGFTLFAVAAFGGGCRSVGRGGYDCFGSRIWFG